MCAPPQSPPFHPLNPLKFEALQQVVPHREGIDKAGFLLQAAAYVEHVHAVVAAILGTGLQRHMTYELQIRLHSLVPHQVCAVVTASRCGGSQLQRLRTQYTADANRGDQQRRRAGYLFPRGCGCARSRYPRCARCCMRWPSNPLRRGSPEVQ